MRIGDGTWTGTPAPNVRFVADPGSGTLTTSIQTDPVTALDGELINGIYQCNWTLGDSEPQVVRAFAYFDDDPSTEITPLYFRANLSEASTTSYSNAAADPDATTVKLALDHLYQGKSLPIGSIVEIARENALVQNSNVPAGFLLCNGDEMSQSQYPDLYGQIGGVFGTAAAGNFKLPDLPGEANFYKLIKT